MERARAICASSIFFHIVANHVAIFFAILFFLLRMVAALWALLFSALHKLLMVFTDILLDLKIMFLYNKSMKIPNLDSIVEVVVCDPFASAQIPPSEPTRIYLGKVLPPDRWLNEYQFNITGDMQWPIRTLDCRNIVSIKILKGAARDIDDRNKNWKITVSKGNVYTVSKSSQGFNCTCAGFQFRRQCRHISEVSAH